MNYFVELTDKRNAFLFEILKESGLNVFAFDAQSKDKFGVEECAFVFSPARKFRPDDLLELPYGATVFAGAISIEVGKLFEAKGIKHINFLDREEFSVKNAELTAEGVLAKIMECTPRSIYENKILLIGYGRCGKAIERLLSRLLLNYSVAIRNATGGFLELGELKEKISEFDVIINTVPSQVIDEKTSQFIDKNAVLLEVASVPCINKDRAEFEYKQLSSLPQVYCAQSAARLMKKRIMEQQQQI